jgi:hypothetical protein
MSGWNKILTFRLLEFGLAIKGQGTKINSRAARAIENTIFLTVHGSLFGWLYELRKEGEQYKRSVLSEIWTNASPFD